MVQRKVKVKISPTQEIEGIDVPIKSSDEKWSEFILEDGTIVRAKVSLMSAIRIPGQFDPAGNPVYAFGHSMTSSIVKVSPDMMQGGQGHTGSQGVQE
jgi:hypothetical protein